MELRELLNSTILTETIKWGGPVYTLNGKNLIGIGAFKNHSALWFFQGALLQKNTHLLVNAQERKTKALRQIRFQEDSKIDKKELLKYIDKTLSLHKQGKEIKPDVKKEILIPSELFNLLNQFRY